MLDFDVAIVGAGPAGSSAAISLARAGTRVLLLERGRFPRHKVCGEFVSAESLHLLQLLLCDKVDLTGAQRLSIARTRIFIDGTVVSAAIDPPAGSITRYELDDALWNAARSSGVDCRDDCEVTRIEHDGDVFSFRVNDIAVKVGAVIDAAGRWSRLRGDKAPAGPKWIGLKCHYHERGQSDFPGNAASDKHFVELETPSVDLYFFDGGYCGVQPIAAGVVNACAMVRSHVATTLNQVFELHSGLAERAEHWTPLFPTVSTAPLVFREPQPLRYLESPSHPKPILCAGDAAAFIDPFAGDGISLAIRTGLAAAESVSSFVGREEALSRAATTYAARYNAEFAPILKAASRIRSLLEKPRAVRAVGLAAMRLPFVANYLIRRTRVA